MSALLHDIRSLCHQIIALTYKKTCKQKVKESHSRDAWNKDEVALNWDLGYLSSILWKRPWCWESLKAGREGDYKVWDGWMVSLTQWTWFWASSGCRWRTGKPGMLLSMRFQRVGHNWVTELNWVQFLAHWVLVTWSVKTCHYLYATHDPQWII